MQKSAQHNIGAVISTPSPPHPHIIGKFMSHQIIFFTLSKITNSWLGKEGTMDCRPLISYLKMCSFL